MGSFMSTRAQQPTGKAAKAVAGIPELLSLILEHASYVEDREAVAEGRYAVLRRLALVNRTFASIAQELLFARIYLCDIRPIPGVDMSKLSAESKRAMAKLTRFDWQSSRQVLLTGKLDLLSNVLTAAPQLAWHVRVARIVHLVADRPALDRFLALLPNLQALRIRLLDHDMLTTLHTGHLTRLSVSLGLPGALPPLLARLAALVELTIYDGTSTMHRLEFVHSDWEAALAQEPHLSCKLRTLTFAFSHGLTWQRYVATWLLGEAKVDLRQLSLSGFEPSDYDVFPSLIERFRWSPSPYEVDAELATLLNRLPMTIRHFTVGPFNCSKDLVRRHLTFLARYLGQTSSIQHLHLIFAAGRPKEVMIWPGKEDPVALYPGYVNIAREGVLDDFLAGHVWQLFETACETAGVELSWATEPWYELPSGPCEEVRLCA